MYNIQQSWLTFYHSETRSLPTPTPAHDPICGCAPGLRPGKYLTNLSRQLEAEVIRQYRLSHFRALLRRVIAEVLRTGQVDEVIEQFLPFAGALRHRKAPADRLTKAVLRRKGRWVLLDFCYPRMVQIKGC
jgi:hypothetical protein